MHRYRMNRLMAADGRCFNVAMDHGMFNEPSFLSGIADARAAIQALVAARPDAIQLSPGQAGLLQDLPGPHKPALVMRCDTANVYGPSLPSHLFSIAPLGAVNQAVRLDAAAVCVNLLMVPNQPELHAACIENIVRIKEDAVAVGMPVIVEPLVMRDNAEAGGYQVDGSVDKILALVRQAVELGADIIKADPTGDVTDYHRVIEVAGDVPVLVRGGGRASLEEVFARTHALMQQGARGIVYGRNVVQHEHPALVTRALMAIVHEGTTPSGAMQIMSRPV